MNDDSISFDKEKFQEVELHARLYKGRLNGFLVGIERSLDDIKQNWEGDLRDAANDDFTTAANMLSDLASNAENIAQLLTSKYNSFNSINYNGGNGGNS